MNYLNRRHFIKNSTLAGMAIPVLGFPKINRSKRAAGKKIGIIGLDTSHAVAFTKEINVNKPAYADGYQIVAAYPRGSLDIASSVKRIPEYIEEVKKMGVEIVPDIDTLLEKVDVVLLETNDGRRHLEQALPVLKAGKSMFIDKPIAASLPDTIAIFKAAEHYKVPVFSSSSLRYMESIQDVVNGKIGKVVGAETFGPSSLEATHPDFYWYGVHAVEMLYTLMGVGCEEVIRVHTEGTDVVVGTWKDGRLGTFRGTRTGKYDFGGTAFGEKGNQTLGPYGGYVPLLKKIIPFFETGEAPVDARETIELFAFMTAADKSKLTGEGRINVHEVLNEAERAAEKILERII